RDLIVTGVQTCALPIFRAANRGHPWKASRRPFHHRGDDIARVRAQHDRGTQNERRDRWMLRSKRLRLAVHFAFVLRIKIARGARSEERRVGKEWRTGVW